MKPIFSYKTRNSLRKIQDQHLKNLPSKNALTYLDTQILCFSIILYKIFSIMYVQFLNFDAGEDFLFVIVQFCFHNIVLCFLFPLYIILKTRRYLPRLWDDNSPIILQNNDFYAVRLSQVSQGADRNLDIIESGV